MTFRGYKLHVAAAAFLLTLLLGLGARHAAHSASAGALQRDFAALSGVARAAVERHGGRTDIVLELGPVDDLQAVYRQADMLRRARLPEDASQLIIKDRRTDALTEAYRRIHYAVYEGAATGAFTRMAEAVGEAAAQLAADVLVTVDDRYIYVQIAAGDDYLYEVVPVAKAAAGGPRERSG